MKLIDQFRVLKTNYPNHIILLKSGMFFVTFQEDAILLKYILTYQIKNERLGFPIKSLDSVLKNLEGYMLNICIKDADIKRIEYDYNNYNELLKIAKKKYYEELNCKVLLEEIAFILKNNPEKINKLKDIINEL